MNRRSFIVTGLVTAATVVVAAFTVYPGAPRWPLNGGFHYVVDLNTTSFPVGSVWDQHAQFALSDWRDIGSTAFAPGFRRSNANPFVNTDGLNAWAWSSQPTQSWLGITYYRYSGQNLLEADIVYNSRPDYTWTNGLIDPGANHPYWPIDFRAIARHETGHAIGLDHQDNLLATMNSIYSPGTGVSHTGASGELPHTDDKFGARFLYTNATTVHNLMATCWVPNAGQAQRLTLGGTYPPGATLQVPVYIENQSNNSFPATQKLGIYLSQNTQISTFDTRIASVQFAGNWSFHAEQLYTFTVSIPPGTTPGTWHVGCIIDWDDTLAERYEGDNAIRIGEITVTGPVGPDLVIDSMTLADRNPVRGSVTTVTASVRNAGGAPVPAGTTTDFYVKSHPGAVDAIWGWPVSQQVLPALAPGQSTIVQAQIVIPAVLCAERISYVFATADAANVVVEHDETNNWRDASMVPRWEAGPGFAIGQTETFLDTIGNDTTELCAKSLGVVPPNTTYFLLWTCSGTSPGFPLPPYGVLPLNYDPCTEIGLALEGIRLHGAIGPLATAAAGSTAVIDGGPWLAPIQGIYVDFAGLFVDLTQLQILGIAPAPVTFLLR
ncbi:MAG: hypothetical protein IPM29_01785 [Planctomycetes bacterium]|nr:hypothetical protein [Planctomycetota bacterium]